MTERNNVVLSVVLPCFNEEKNIPILGDELIGNKFLRSIESEFIFVDDASQDATLAELYKLASRDPRVKVIALRNNVGQTPAIAAGVECCSGQYVALMDADLQNDPHDLERMFYALKDDDCDIVSGWRVNRKDSGVRVILSNIANWLIRKLVKVDVKDLGCTLKIFRGDAIRGFPLYGEMHRMLVLHVAQSNRTVKNITVNHRPRTHGISKYGFERIYKVLFDLLLVIFFRKFMQKPMYVFGLCGGLLIVISFFSAVYASYLKIDQGLSFIQTPLPTLAMMSFALGIVCLLLGVIAEMLMRVLHEATTRKPFDIKDRR